MEPKREFKSGFRMSGLSRNQVIRPNKKKEDDGRKVECGTATTVRAKEAVTQSRTKESERSNNKEQLKQTTIGSVDLFDSIENKLKPFLEPENDKAAETSTTKEIFAEKKSPSESQLTESSFLEHLVSPIDSTNATPQRDTSFSPITDINSELFSATEIANMLETRYRKKE